MIQELPIEFVGIGEVKGFKFRLIHSHDTALMYEVESNCISYEVFLRKTTPVCIDFKARIYSTEDFKVRYPKSKNFGKWAWHFSHYDLALHKFNSLCES
jgi:hypothetical protein